MTHSLALAQSDWKVLDLGMGNPIENPVGHPRAAIVLAALAAAALIGAAIAAWLNHGPQIFLSMAADAWAYCF